MRILILEDDQTLSDMLRRSLVEAGHSVEAVGDLASGARWWADHPFDAILLDLNLPQSQRPGSGEGSGLELLRTARARGDRTPVIVLTARNRTDERIAGLDAGADDYLGKPFDLSEVEARLRALARRATGTNERTAIGGLQLDRSARRCTLNDEAFDLPAREFAVLWELMTPPGRVVSKTVLSAKLSDYETTLGDNALEAFVSRLRRKLLGSGAEIRTLRGLGYVLEAERAVASRGES